MADTKLLTGAQVVLLAVYLTTESNLESLHTLASHHPRVLSPVVVYRILYTYLPQDVSPKVLVAFLKALESNFAISESQSAIPSSTPIHALSIDQAQRQARQIQLEQLPPLDRGLQTDLLSRFLVARAHRTEAATNDLPSILHTIEPFLESHEGLREWFVSKLLPLLRLNYEYYPSAQTTLSLQALSGVAGSAGVGLLLENARLDSENPEIGRDIRGVVGPWIRGATKAKRRRISHVQTKDDRDEILPSWKDVNEWLLDTSLQDFKLVAKAVTEWKGPQDVDLGGYDVQGDDEICAEDVFRYHQSALALIFAIEDSSPDTRTASWRILGEVTRASKLEPPGRADGSPEIRDLSESLIKSPRAVLLHNGLLRAENELTKPSKSSVSFLVGLLTSIDILAAFKCAISVREAAELSLFGSQERQMQELRRILQQIPRITQTNIRWPETREQLLWLRTWVHSKELKHSDNINYSRRSLLGTIPVYDFEREVFNAVLSSNEYDTALDLYVRSSNSPFDITQQEGLVVTAIYNAYDNATNGNRTRGGMKRAYEMLKAFEPAFKDSTQFRELGNLISATHALSFYQLTLLHGVPFQPVSIRAHKDPIALIEKVLDQNPKAYTKLDDLVDIGRKFVLAGLPSVSRSQTAQEDAKPVDVRVSDAEHRVTYLAITSALQAHDFDTAHSYITIRLSPQSGSSTSSALDDTSWRAAYAAGRYRPPSTPQTVTSRISSLSRRMELLSLALTLAPTPEPLSEILGTWRRCEEEMESLKSQEVSEERAWNSRSGDTSVPGDFGPDARDVDMATTERELAKRSTARRAAAYEAEAPMGLLDVARGAAAAIRKSAFPLHGAAAGGAAGNAFEVRDTARSSTDTDRVSLGAADADATRVRKRDVVSNMVTGGLVSGMGWILGAQPVNRDEHGS